MKNKPSNGTSEFLVRRYTFTESEIWNVFIANSKNATFLFNRNFMDYHKDRFIDNSLLAFKNDKLVAVLPANVVGNNIYSHQGLSYGGLILDRKTKFKDALNIFKEILKFLNSEGKDKLQLKQLPNIYANQPNDELEYLHFLTEAKMIRTDILSIINLKNPLKIASNRMEGVKKANKLGLKIQENNDFEAFWNSILIPNLQETHNAKPVHSVEEIKMLAEKFPKNILQFNVMLNDKIVGGATIFGTEKVAHVQYISADNNKQQYGTLDFLFHYLITERFANKDFFDFGTSNENAGKNINEGLLYWKECFGARSISQSFYEVKTENYILLDTIFI